METITLQANAKINLGLDVLRRREDGYHEVKMVMQTIGISDSLTFSRIPAQKIVLETDRDDLPVDARNLVYRAVALMQEKYALTDGVSVRITKRIPMAAGMAGGSADAAAAIHAMDALYGLGLSLEQKQALGVTLGADVPYCLLGGTALAEGIGEILTPLPALPCASLVVAKPDFSVSTKFVYENLHADRLSRHPDIDGMIQSIGRGDLLGIASRMENVLESVTAKAYPVIGEMKAFLIGAGAMNALMSGSGPTVFGVFEKEDTARAACEAMKAGGFGAQVFLTGFRA